MTRTFIYCDHCKRDIEPDSHVPRWRICVGCTVIAPISPTAVHVVPPLPRQLDFCSLACLGEYLKSFEGRK